MAHWQPAGVHLAAQELHGTPPAYSGARDRHERYHQEFEAKGCSRAQAEGTIKALKELNTASLVTKADINQALGEIRACTNSSVPDYDCA